MNALKAFAVLAETGSFTAAGRKLNVTHAAVSQQVRSLERILGVTLVDRQGPRTRLTREGSDLARDLAEGFQKIRDGIETLTDLAEQKPVQVSMSPAFAVSWLMPRLTGFQSHHPEITLLLNPTSDVVELRPGGIDLAIRYQDQTTVPSDADVLMVSDMVVVGTPQLLEGHEISTPRDLLNLPWLQELGTNEATDWMAMQGVTLHRPMTISHMPGNLIMEAVRRGDGLTYTVRKFVEREIKSGQLIELHRMPSFGVFHIVSLPGALRPAVKVFRNWLLRQVRDG